MKGIYDILKDHGIEVADDVKEAFEKDLNANYKTVAELTKKDAAISQLQDQLKTAKDGLKAFEGVDVDGLKGQISKLTADLDQKEKDWAGKLAGIEFDHSIEAAIGAAKGKNAKAIKALLDMDTLRKSTNRDADVAAAIESVKKENDYLFDSEEKPGKYAGGTGTGTGNKSKSIFDDPDIASFARAAGLDREK